MKTFIALLLCTGLVASVNNTEVNERAERFVVSISVCVDLISTCISFGLQICTDPNYRVWVTINCAKTCKLCSNGTGTGSGTGSGGTMTGTFSAGGGSGTRTRSATGGIGSMSGTSSGCSYKSQFYQQGQTWNDGCKYKCRCVDGNAEKYECRKLCLNWNLPPTCHMNPPAAGKCCPKPACPSGVILPYPDGHVEE